MAQVDLYGNPVDDQWSTQPHTFLPGEADPNGGRGPGGGSGQYTQQHTDPNAPGYSPYADISERDVTSRLQQLGGGLFNDSDIGDVMRTYYNSGPHGGQGGNLEQAYANAARKYAERAASERNVGGGGGGGTGGGGVPGQFDDPYTNQLERLAQAQLGEIRGNPGLDQLMAFLNKQFADLSTNPGYSPEELAILNTQAFEPIESRRSADQQRVLDRTAARGFLPSSGLTESMAQDVDTAANQQRTVAGRDLGVAAIGQRQADLNQAMQVASLIGLDIPKAQRGEELNVAQLLYQLPRNALQDLMMVLNGSPNSSQLFSQGLQTQNLQNQQNYQDDLRNQQLMQQIGGILSGLFS